MTIQRALRAAFAKSSASLAALMSAAALLPANAAAQTASQITKDSYAPPLTSGPRGGVTLPQTYGVTAPEDAADLIVTPSGLTVKGGLPELAGETAAIEARIKNKRVTGADIFQAAADLEAAYARKGYVLARVTLPPQTIEDGSPVTLTVTNGFIEGVDVSALPPRAGGYVNKVLAPLADKRGLTRRRLERRLLLAGDANGMQLTSTLAPGQQQGGALIVVDGEARPLTASFQLSNGLSKSMGRYSAMLGLDANNLVGQGESAYMRVGGYPGFNGESVFSQNPRNRQLVLGVTAPIGGTGFWVNLEGVRSHTEPSNDLPYTMQDVYERIAARAGYHWLRSRDANINTQISLVAANEKQRIDLNGGWSDFTEDRTRVVRIMQSGDYYPSWGERLSGSVTASFGLDAFDAREASLALPLSRDGAEPDFAKIEAALRYDRNVFEDRMRLSLSMRAQTSFGDPLVASEQFSLTGADGLSAYDSGAVTADSGIVARTEAAFPQALAERMTLPGLENALSPYVFAAAGYAALQQPTAVEKDYTRLAAFGAGLRVSLDRTADRGEAYVSLEYAHGTQGGNQDQEDRILFTLNVGF